MGSVLDEMRKEAADKVRIENAIKMILLMAYYRLRRYLSIPASHLKRSGNLQATSQPDRQTRRI